MPRPVQRGAYDDDKGRVEEESMLERRDVLERVERRGRGLAAEGEGEGRAGVRGGEVGVFRGGRGEDEGGGGRAGEDMLVRVVFFVFVVLGDGVGEHPAGDLGPEGHGGFGDGRAEAVLRVVAGEVGQCGHGELEGTVGMCTRKGKDRWARPGS